MPRQGGKLNDLVCESIVGHIRKGVPPQVAAESLGITFRTFQEWMKRGASDDYDDCDTPYRVFFEEVSRGAADAQVTIQKRLMRSLDRVESANMRWLLERLDANTWGQQLKIHVVNEMRHEMAIEIMGVLREELDHESFARVESRLLQEGDSAGAVA